MPLIDLEGIFSNVSTPVLLGVGVFVLAVGWLIWTVARKIVRFGFFVLAVLVGAVVAYVANAAFIGPPSLPVVAAQALAFAWLWCTIRAKVARLVSVVALVLFVRAFTAFGPEWLATKEVPNTKQTAVPETVPERTKTKAP